MDRSRIAAVRGDQPGVMHGLAVPVHVVPTRPDDRPVVRDARAPLVGFVEGQAPDVRPVGGHVEERIGRADPPATQVAPAPLADERHSPAGHEARGEVVPPPVGHHAKVRPVDAGGEDVIRPPLRPVPAEGIEVFLMAGVPFALDVSKRDSRAVERQGRRDKRTGLEQQPSFEPTVGHDGILQQVANLRGLRKRSGEDIKPAAGNLADAVILIAHVAAAQSFALDQQEVLEIEQRIGKRHLSADHARRSEQGAARHAELWIDLAAQVPQDRQLLVKPATIRRIGHGLQIGQQRRHPAQDHIRRVAVAFKNSRLAIKRLGRDDLEPLALGQVISQRKGLLLPIVGQLDAPAARDILFDAGHRHQDIAVKSRTLFRQRGHPIQAGFISLVQPRRQVG